MGHGCIDDVTQVARQLCYHITTHSGTDKFVGKIYNRCRYFGISMSHDFVIRFYATQTPILLSGVFENMPRIPYSPRM